MTIINNHIQAFHQPATSLVNADYTGHFKSGIGDLVIREELPMLQFSADLCLDQIQSQVDAWNRFVRESLPGTGYYMPNPSADISDKTKHHFSVVCNTAFYDAFVESMIHEEIVELPSDQYSENDDAALYSEAAYDSFVSFV